MKRLLKSIAVIVAIAVPVHLAAVWYAPRLIMGKIVDGSAQLAGGFNKPLHLPAPDHTARRVVLPSPDLRYSSCILDLAGGPVAVEAVPPASYFSLSLFDDATDNIFVINDKGAGGKPINLLVVGPGAPAITPRPGETLVRMPSNRGLLLLRALAATPEMAFGAEAARQTLACAPRL